MKTVCNVVFLCMAGLLAGCLAIQPVKWSKNAPMDMSKGAKVEVRASCQMPSPDVAYLQTDIQQQVNKVLTGGTDIPDAYKIDVTITKYDKGSAFARFMLIGLGQMYLCGTIEIKQGEPPVVIRAGGFQKNYCVGGIAGGMATMQKDVLPTVGQAIADALKDQQAK